MKSKWFIYLVVLAGMSAAVARPMGPSTGGGGFVVTCPQTPVSEASVELLDIYEGRKGLRYQMVEASGDLKRDYLASVDRTYTIQGHPNLAEEIHADLVENLVGFMQSSKFVETPQELPMAEDLGKTANVPSQCQIQQVAYFEDHSTTIYILKPLWDRLNSRDQAALVQHELWYHHYRSAGEATSENARRAVATIFAASGPEAILNGVPPNTPQFFVSEWSEFKSSQVSAFYAINYTASNLTRFQFTQISGVGILSKTWADFSLQNWSFKLGRSTENPVLVSCILQTPGVDQEQESPVNGGVAGYTVRMRLKTGEPIQMSLYKGGQLMSSGQVGGGTNCSAVL